MKKLLLASIVVMIGGAVSIFLSCRKEGSPSTTNSSSRVEGKQKGPDQEIAESVLRHLLWNNGLGDGTVLKLKACYISVDLNQYATPADFQFREADKYFSTKPPTNLMNCIQDIKLSLQPAPTGAWFPELTKTGSNGCVVFYINRIVGRTADRAIVMAGYYFAPQNAGEYEYTMKFYNGQWTVEKVQCISMS